MSWLQAAAAAGVPILVQFLCWLVLSEVDPCKGNPGCMAGSMTVYTAFLLLPSCALLFLLLALLERASRRIGPWCAVIINTALALAPFGLIFWYL